MAKIKVLIVHTEEDKEAKDDLVLHLSSQKEDDKASFWDRDAILPGSDEELVIAAELEKADIILLLLSADFFNSDYCLALEQKAFKLEKTKNVTVVPLMLRHFYLGAKYDSKTTLPHRNHPILGKYWDSEDKAFNNVAEKIGDIINSKIEGGKIPHLRPPSMIKTAGRKFKRPAGMLMYLLFLAIIFSILFLPKRNLPVVIKLVVNQVDFQLTEKIENGFWLKSVFAKKAMIKNFNNVIIPGRSLHFLDKTDQFADIPGSQIRIDRLSASVEPYLYLFDVDLTEWDISDSALIQLRMATRKSLFIAVDKGESSGTFNFNDSLEFYTESGITKLGSTEYKDNLEAVIYSSVGRVNFAFDELGHSILLDSLKQSTEATNLHVTGLQFEKDLRNDKGTLQSSILSGEITVDGVEPIRIDNPETVFLKLKSSDPLRIQNINVLDNSIELLIISDSIKDIQKGTSLTTMESEMPTILEWLFTKYELRLLAGLLAVLSPFIIFGKNLFKKRSY